MTGGDGGGDAAAGSDIRELDPTTVERIAAGEVVERPASVVKELVENSLDADAARVEVAVEAGGTERIRVRDDGVGMTEADVRAAVRKHTTSKLREVGDLERGVGTLGFRGEALHAIGAVSRMTVRTRPAGADRGTELRVEGGEVTAVEPAGCPEGTTVEVADLFYNVPARRKYLKQPGTEFAHVNTVVTSYALANPAVAVALEHGGRETFATTGRDSLEETVMSVYGREVARAMIEVESPAPGGPLSELSGLVSHPETTRSGREYLSTFVNGRYVTAAAVREAVVDAYGTQLAPDRYPFAVLFLELPGEQVDVNVHPRKLEVRFASEEAVRAQVREAVEQTLLEAGLVRSGAPRGRSAPAQTELAPEGADAEESTAAAESRTGGNGTATGTTDAGEGGRSESSRATSPDRTREESADVYTTPDRGDPHDARSVASAGEQTRFGEAVEPDFDSLPPMRVLGQLQDTYVVAETDAGLALVDQHAADERVNYERLRERFEGETATQALAEPVEVALTAREAALFEEFADALARLGFHADRVDERTVRVSTLPALVADAAGPELVRDVLSAFVSGEAAAADTVDAAADALLADLACYPSVTGNTSLTEGSIRDLLDALDDCENPYACPHGRPVIIELDGDELAERFERDYPGHAGRRED